MVLLYDNCLAAASKYKAAKAFHIFTRDVGSIKKKIHGQIIDESTSFPTLLDSIWTSRKEDLTAICKRMSVYMCV